MSKRKALGQGLDALLGGGMDLDDPGSPAPSGVDGVRSVPIGSILPNPEQPRERFDQDSLAELAESIRQQGVIQPILAEAGADGRFLIIAGERRWRAAKKAGLAEVPVLVRSFTREEKLEIALVENVQREDLTPLEEARAYHHLMDALNLSQQDVADKVGKNRSTVANSLRLLKLSESARKSLDAGEITAGHARALLSVVNPADQDLLFRIIREKGMSVREAEARATAMNRGHKGRQPEARGSAPAASPRDPELEHLEQRFIEALGTKVSLKGSLKRGRLEVSWFSADDLDRLYSLLTGKA